LFDGRRVAAIIPALDEEEAIGPVLAAIDRSLVDTVVVGDNGSRDRTAEVARAGGAVVVHEPLRGYGSACLRAIAEVRDHDILVFLDADGADDPGEIPRVLAPLATGADLVIGSRVLGEVESGALTPIQRFGNALACGLVHAFWGVRYTDLGPFRAVAMPAYRQMEMRDPDFGWTIEMQVRAVQLGLRVGEVPVSCRIRRGGRSKVSGTLSGSFHAGRRILALVLKARFGRGRVR
jgi:glycosyltransferase involved in cell wall biosynthesis